MFYKFSAFHRLKALSENRSVHLNARSSWCKHYNHCCKISKVCPGFLVYVHYRHPHLLLLGDGMTRPLHYANWYHPLCRECRLMLQTTCHSLMPIVIISAGHPSILILDTCRHSCPRVWHLSSILRRVWSRPRTFCCAGGLRIFQDKHKKVER